MVLKVECNKSASATLPSSVSSCKSHASSQQDHSSSHTSFSDGELARNVREGIKHRILYLSEQLRVEKANRDENTMGYLKLVSKADRHQASHIRQAFEKVNQRTSATIAQIERKLYQCHRQLKELEATGCPKTSAIKADSGLATRKHPGAKTSSSKLGGEDSQLNSSAPARSSTLKGHLTVLQHGKLPSTKHVARQRKLLLLKIKEELAEIKKVHAGLQVSQQRSKEKYLADMQEIVRSLQEGKNRRLMIEGQVNEHLQRHQDEIYHLKQHLACNEEKMAYLSYERTKEIWEVMKTFKIRVSKLEALQETTRLEAIASLRSRPQDFLLRVISLILTLVTVLLVLVSTLCSYPSPLVSSRLRTCSLLMLIGLGTLIWQKRHTISILDWQTWVPSRWRSDIKPPTD